MDNLRSKTVQGLLWSFGETIVLRSVQLVIGIVLARLLIPEQFGLIGMLTIFMAVSQTFLDSGFGAALIQKRNATQTDICSIFYFNIVIGFVVAALLCLAAPWVAAFYSQPMLTSLTRVLSLTIVINSFGLIQDIKLAKEVNFKTRVKVTLPACLLSGAIGIGLALAGYGVWSLALQQITNSLFRTVLLWVLNTWRPSFVFSLGALRDLFGFGSRLLTSGLLNTIFNNIYLLVIGKLFSATSLGFYTRAKTFEEMPSQTFAIMVGRVTFPIFSSIQDEPVRLKRGLKKALTTMVFVNFPMMIGLALVARPLVFLLLTEKWAPCIPYLQLLCIVGLLFPLHLINLNVLQAMGRSDLFLRLEVIKKVLIVISIAVTYRWGIVAMIYGQVVVSFFSYYLNSYYNGVLLGYPIREQITDIMPYIMVSIVMSLVVWPLTFLSNIPLLYLLMLQILAGAVVYILICSGLRLTAYQEITEVIKVRKLFLLTTLGINK